MDFLYKGSYEGFFNELSLKITQYNEYFNKDYRIFELDEGHISFGICRMGHSGGLLYNATLCQCCGGIEIKGKIESGDESNQTIISKVEICFMLLIIYMIIVMLIGGITYFVCNLLGWRNFVVPIIVSLITIVGLRVNAIRQEKKTRNDFVLFMTEYAGCCLLK